MTTVRASEIFWFYPDVAALDLNGPTVPFRPFREEWIDRPALDLFRATVEEFGDRIACEDLGERLTYAQVWAACRRLTSMIDDAVPGSRSASCYRTKPRILSRSWPAWRRTGLA